MRLAQADFICALALLVICIILFMELQEVPWEGQVFPVGIVCLLGICGTGLGFRAWRSRLNCTGPAIHFFGDVSPRKWLIITAAFSVYVLFSMNISFLCGTFIFAFIMPVFLEYSSRARQWFTAFCYSITLVGCFYIFFIRIMHFNFPAFEW